MEVLTEAELAAKLDFRRPLTPPPPDHRLNAWPIPFEYGANAGTGTRISIAMAKTIAAELRAAVAEAEKREVLIAFEQEKARSAALCQQASKAQDETAAAHVEIATLKRALRRRKKATRG
jgi:3-methyladenine DNA glycosylase/8-oxoguanine DNA glycosylase